MNFHYGSASETAYLFRHAAYEVGVLVDILLHSTITDSLHLCYR